MCLYFQFDSIYVFSDVRVTHFTHSPIYNFRIYRLFLSANSIGLHSVVDTSVDFEPIYPGIESRVRILYPGFDFLCCVFCHHYYSANSTLLSLLRFSFFITSYDAQASSAFSLFFFMVACKYVAS